MSDLISRQRAIDAFDCSVGGVPVESVKYVSEYADKMMSRIKALPSAQPKKRTEERTETHGVCLDAIDRQVAIDAWKNDFKGYINALDMPKDDYNGIMEYIDEVPSAQPEPCEGVVSRNAIIQKLNTMDRYVSEELRLCDTDKKFQKNEVFIVDDVYEEIVEQLPSAQPEIVRCGQCKYAEVADKEDAQDGYTCQFHRGSVWFSGSYCSWAERRTDEAYYRKE